MFSQTRDAGRVRAGGAATRSTVRGRVVYADTGNPVRRAEVIMTNARTGERVGGAVANVKGEFSFDELPAGRYSLLALAPSLVAPYVVSGSDAAAELLDLVESRDGLAEVEVDGNRGADIMLRARRGGAITGRVTYEDGEPVADAQVRLFRLRQGRIVWVTSTWERYSRDKANLKTDSRGVYRVGGLSAGEYIVRVSESRLTRGVEGNEGDVYGDGSLVVTYFPSAGSVKDAAPVRVYEGRDTDRVDIRIPERTTRKLGGTFTLKRGGHPVAGAEIMLTRKDEGAFPQRLSGDESARTDRNGRWEVSGVPDGEYLLTVSPTTAYVAAGLEGTRSVNVLPVKRELTVSGADLADLKLEAEEGGRVSGTVSVEGGKGLPDFVRIEALRDGEEVDTTFPRAGGKFEFDSVPPGEVRFRVSGFPEDRFYVKSISRNQLDLLREPVRVGEGARVEGVSVVLAADVATLKGQALSRHDGTSPLAHAWVVLVTADEKLRRAGALPRVVRADARGRFEIAGGPGEYFVAAMPGRDLLRQNFRLDEEYVRRSQSTLARVTLKAGESVSGVKVMGGER
ncbi:MAG: carboxypeptidase regulatory-like domain-containing protein [Pyrinomonadaceae bacterium]